MPNVDHPAYETARPVTSLATVVLCNNPGEMTLEGTNSLVLRHRASDTAVVVDPGPDNPAHIDALIAAAGRVGCVLITHRHGDHTDGIDRIHRETGAPVRALGANYCRDGAPLVDGEVITGSGVALTVIATPGHTADSVSFLVHPEGAAPGQAPDSIVLGDTILGYDSTVLDSRDGDLGDYLASLDRLATVGQGVTGLPGHGPDVRSVADAANGLTEHRRARLAQVRAARAELGPQASAAELTAHIYTGLTPFLMQVAEQSTLVALRYLERSATEESDGRLSDLR